MWGLTGVQKEAVLAAKRSLVTVEEIVDELEPRPNAVVLPNWVVTCVAEVPERRASLLRPRLLRARQRLLPRVGRDQQGPQRLRRLARGAARGGARRELDDRRDDERRRGARAARRRRLLRRHRAAEHGREPRAPHPRARAGADLRGRRDRREAGPAADVDRRRHPGRDRRRRGQRPRGLQLLAAAGPDRGRLPRRGADRPLREHQHDGHRARLRQPEGAAARRGRRARDRRVVRRGRRDRAPDHALVRREGRLRHLRRLRQRPGRPRAPRACAAAGRCA